MSNWFRESQQLQMPFMQEQHEIDETIPHVPAEQVLDDFMIEDPHGIRYVLDKSGIEWKEIGDFPSANPIIVFDNGELYVIVDGSVHNATEWIDGLTDYDLLDYVSPIDEGTYWDGVAQGSKVYHGTYEDRVEDIMRDGLEARCETRGISNRHTGCGVFTSANTDTVYSHYDQVIEIDLGKMKQDGYMPEVSDEEPFEEKYMKESLANMIGLEDYYYEVDSSDGLNPDTVIFFDDIPAKYLTII